MRSECSFEAFGWVCGSTGYLGPEGFDRPGETAHPCPQCNTRAFLEKAYAQMRRKRYALRKCPCCGPGMPGDEVWSNAVATARRCNPTEAEEVLGTLERIEAGGRDIACLEQRSPIASPRIRTASRYQGDPG